MRTLNFIAAITSILIGLIALLTTPRSISQAAPCAICTWFGLLDSAPCNWSDVAQPWSACRQK